MRAVRARAYRPWAISLRASASSDWSRASCRRFQTPQPTAELIRQSGKPIPNQRGRIVISRLCYSGIGEAIVSRAATEPGSNFTRGSTFLLIRLYSYLVAIS